MKIRIAHALLVVLSLGISPVKSSIAEWWAEDGLITREQWIDLESSQEGSMRWCILVELWLGQDEAFRQGCGQSETSKSGKSRGSWNAQLDTAGHFRKQTWMAHLNARSWKSQVAWKSDSSWNDLGLDKAWVRFQNPHLRWQAGDISSGDAGMDPWSGDFRGMLVQGNRWNWQLGTLVENPESAGIQAGWNEKKRSDITLWLWKQQNHTVVWTRFQTAGMTFTTRFQNIQQGSWNHLRYRQNLLPSLFSVGGDLHLRTGTQLPAMLNLPASFSDVRIWSAQWQKVHIGKWDWHARETIVLKEERDSVALALHAERRRTQARFSAEFICRSVREDCGMPRATLAAGIKPWKNGADSLYGESRLQGNSLQSLAHIPRLRCGWERRLTHAIRMSQNLTVPENWDGERALDWRQETLLLLPSLNGIRIRMQLRWGFHLHSDLGVFPGIFQFRTEGEW